MIHQFNNSPIYYTRNGQGPATILLHGFLESSTMWQDIAVKLSENQTVITIDFPGFGKSAMVSEVHSMELMAQITSEILRVENIEIATIIGHSMGGYVALAIAESSPKLISKLILLNSSPLEDGLERVKNRDRALAIIDKNKDAFISMAISNLFTETERTNFTSEILQLKEEAFQLTSQGIKAAIIGMRDRKNRTSVLKNFRGTKIIICAKEDAIAPIDGMIDISEETNSTLYEVEGGHMSWITNPAEIVKIVRFIE